jgi:ABC-type lipoprotein export system ATPase subunit
MRVSAGYDIPRRRPSPNASLVMDHFGVAFETGRRVIASELELPIAEGDVVCFTGPSGSGKSSLLRAVVDELRRGTDQQPASRRVALGETREARNSARSPHTSPANRGGILDMANIPLGESLVIDAPGLPAADAMRLLSQCGLGEAQLMLRTPGELSDGERYRLRLALALAQQPRWIIADEFTATLDRTLAKVIAYNVRRLADRTATGFVIATTHDDVLEDLAPTLHVRCSLDGRLDVCRNVEPAALAREVSRFRREPHRQALLSRPLSLARRMFVTIGARRDWPYFARWHYRGGRLPATQFVTLLWESRVESRESRAGSALLPAFDFRPSTFDSQPIAICVFTAPPLALRERHRFFDQSGRWSRLRFQMLNRQLVTLARVVVHPTYRGAGIATAFVRRSCELCPWPWIETHAAMGHVNPLFERAGFTRVGVSDRKSASRRGHSSIYGTKATRHAEKPLITQHTFEQNRRSRPVYYVFDNRRNVPQQRAA